MQEANILETTDNIPLNEFLETVTDKDVENVILTDEEIKELISAEEDK